MKQHWDQGRSPWRGKKFRGPAPKGNWATGPHRNLSTVPVKATEFEQLVDRLGIGPDEWPQSQAVRNFVKKNYKRRYVPELLLIALDRPLSEDMVDLNV